MRSVEQDLTTKARIRDATIELVARTGGTPTVRAIAEAAGVSAALVVHHFGSKEGLRAVCDAWVLQEFHAVAADADGFRTADLLAQISRKRDLAPLAGYAIHALLDGRPFAHTLFGLLVGDTLRYLDAGVAEGAIRPTEHDRARAIMLTTYSLGTLVLARYALAARTPPGETTDQDDGTDDGGAAWSPKLLHQVQDLFGAAGVDLFTHGLFTDDRYLQALQAYLRNQQGAS